MDAAENLQKELESCICSINTAGLDNLDPKNIEKLEKISAAATACGMNQGEKLVNNLINVLKTFKEGKSTKDSVSLRMTALDFYLKNTTGAATGEL